MEIKSNPIGNAQDIPEFNDKIQDLSQKWDQNLKYSSENWMISWGIKSRATLSLATGFLLGALDELIITVDLLLENGPDKKATVLSGLDRLYEYVMKEALPIWLRPFASVVKNYIIYSLASFAIDYIVSKYKDGNWRSKINKK